MKRCPACKETKRHSEFSRSSRAKSGLQTYCKRCYIQKDNARPDLRKARADRYRAKWPAESTWRFLKRRATRDGLPLLSVEEFSSWYAEQPQCCTYCGMEASEAKDRFDHALHVDRKECALGYAKDNIVFACHRCNVVKNAYLTHNQMMQVAGMFFGGKVNSHDAMVKALQTAIRVADEAREVWDKAPDGMKAGKLLIALSDPSMHYRADISEMHAVLASIKETV